MCVVARNLRNNRVTRVFRLLLEYDTAAAYYRRRESMAGGLSY